MQNARTSLHIGRGPLSRPGFDLVSRMATLAEAHDERELLDALARLAVPTLADLCVVDVVGDAAPRRAVVVHHNPAQQKHAESLLNEEAILACRTEAKSAALSGHSWMRAELNLSECPASLRKVLQQLDALSALAVPLRVSSRTFAVVSFITTTASGRTYDDDDLAMAEHLVGQVSTLIENQRLHELIRARDEKMRLALEKSNVRMFEVDRDLKKTWLTEPMQSTSNDAPELRLAIEAAQRESFRTGERTRIEGNTCLAGDGRDWVLTHTPVLGPDGQVVRIIGTAVDVTEERRVQRQLSEALEFRDQVLGILGHDLRNPLSAILGVLGLAKLDGPLPPKAGEHIAQVEHAARRMLEMIGTLLDFSEARFAHTLPISLADVELREVGATVVEELRSAQPHRAIELVARGDTSGQWDRSRLAQVASNLLGNALTHGDPLAVVRLSIEDRGDAVELAVHNRGPVISEELRATLFQPFRRGTPERRGVRGLGLGLFIARQVVVAHGGTIDVRSSADEGTTFTARLPRHSQAPSA
jgi:signal transduction histidine kinase